MPGTDSQDYLIGTFGTFILNYRNGLFVSKLRDGVSFALGLKHCRVTFPTKPPRSFQCYRNFDYVPQATSQIISAKYAVSD